jgi:hypothetical protein
MLHLVNENHRVRIRVISLVWSCLECLEIAAMRKSPPLFASALLAALCLQCKDSTPVDSNPSSFILSGHILFVSSGSSGGLVDGLWAIDMQGGSATMHLVAEGASDARAASNTSLVAYAKLSPGHSQDIHINTISGTDERNITQREGVSEWGPDIAAGGSTIAFSAFYKNSGASAICLVDTTGRGLQAITDSLSRDAHAWLPRWSPDGSRLAYIHRTQAGPSPMYCLATVSPSGADQKDLARTSSLYAPQWSPGGKYIAYASLSGSTVGISIYDVETEIAKELSVPLKVLDPVGLAWTPNAGLCFVGRNAGDSLFSLYYTADVAAGTIVEIVGGIRYPETVVISPDGAIVAVMARGESGRIELYAMKLDGSARRTVVQLPMGTVIQAGGFTQWIG